MEKLFNKISNYLETKESTSAYFSDNNYIPIKFSKDYFKEITKPKNNKLAFIDGGNIEIAGNNNFSLQMMRVYYTIYKNNKRINYNQTTYFVFIDTINEENKFIYKAEIYKEEILVNTFKFDLKNNNEQLKPENIIGYVRRIYELKKAIESINYLEKNDAIVLDGNLHVREQQEKKEIDELYFNTTKKEIYVSAISKTSSLLTNKGQNLVSYINNLSNIKKWYYYPICKNNNPEHKAELIIVKFHEKSEYSFIIDIYNEKYIDHIIALLANNSKDPVFLGYPYGLIESDHNARCQENEKQFLQIKFIQSSNNKEIIKKLINSNKAHDILDSIK
jgi:hypothetical protein